MKRSGQRERDGFRSRGIEEGEDATGRAAWRRKKKRINSKKQGGW